MMYHAAKAQAKERADREQHPMNIYKALEQRKHDSAPQEYWYVRTSQENVLQGSFFGVHLIYVETVYPQAHKENPA